MNQTGHTTHATLDLTCHFLSLLFSTKDRKILLATQGWFVPRLSGPCATASQHPGPGRRLRAAWSRPVVLLAVSRWSSLAADSLSGVKGARPGQSRTPLSPHSYAEDSELPLSTSSVPLQEARWAHWRGLPA